MKAYLLDFRQKIVDTYFKEGPSQRKIAKRFGVTLSFVEKLLKQQRETGDIAAKPHGGGRSLKLSAEKFSLVAALVEADNNSTLEELCQQLQEKTTITISRSTMGRVLQKLKLTRKKKTLHATERDTPRVQQARLDYWERIREIDPEDLVFIDESGVNLAMIGLYARSLHGERVVGDRPQQRGQNVSIVDALTLHGLIAIMRMRRSKQYLRQLESRSFTYLCTLLISHPLSRFGLKLKRSWILLGHEYIRHWKMGLDSLTSKYL